MSQQQLAEACGISFQQIQKYENGANRISFSRLVHIASALKCRVADLTTVLDQPDVGTATFDFLELMTAPGAIDLLKRFEALEPGARRTLVDFLRSLEVKPADGD